MSDLKRMRLHRFTFFAAGGYNLLWGLLSAVYPVWFFQLARMEEPTYPEVFACLGMVIGLYGVLYIRVALEPESGVWVALIGLIGKILGPIGCAYLVVQGKWPVSSLFLIFANDIVWWIPFGLYLHDAWRATGRSLPRESERGG
ncbi:MAG: hypothetical protein O7H41_05255 [Planctomycetota bacterium]|nr:hypothetical protein [Planctomycetota bacterium]